MRSILRRDSLKLLFESIFLLIFATGVSCPLAGCGGDTDLTSKAQNPSKPPFSLSVVSGRRDRSITISKKEAPEFYVVLTNISQESQPVWEYWNSWGFQAISFELSTADGKKFVLTTKDRDFSYNFPSTFIVEPGEHQVFAIRFDDSWAVEPALPKVNEMPVALKAIYSVSANPDTARFHVWTGRVDSHSYNLKLLQY
jgi:hypothetical protein